MEYKTLKSKAQSQFLNNCVGNVIPVTLLVVGMFVTGSVIAQEPLVTNERENTSIKTKVIKSKAVKSNGFVPAKLESASRPTYPIDRFKKSTESSLDDGLVEIHFMVNKDGSTGKPLVVRSSMPRFVEPTLRMLAKRKYQPATLNGKLVESAQKETVAFRISAADLRNSRGGTLSLDNGRKNGVPDGYQSYYDQLTEELAKDQPSQEKAQNLLDKMIGLKHQTYYSLAYHSLARYRFAERYQGSDEKIAALEDLVWYDPKIKPKFQILQGELKSALWNTLLKQQIEAGHYAGALMTYEEIQKISSKKSPFLDAIEQIIGLKTGDQTVARKINIGDNRFVLVPLLKRNFALSEVKGQFSQFILRCEGKYSELNYQQDAQYQLPKNWGACSVQVTGSINSSAKLLMF